MFYYCNYIKTLSPTVLLSGNLEKLYSNVSKMHYNNNSTADIEKASGNPRMFLRK
jgi:hypothetical protein